MKFILFLTVAFTAFAQAENFECPLTKNKLPFVGLSIFDGNPKLKVDLKPDNGDEAPPHRWTLTGVTPWAACRYGKEKLLVVKKLKSKISNCTTEESLVGSQKFNKIKCI